jgi:hypothetical protein
MHGLTHIHGGPDPFMFAWETVAAAGTWSNTDALAVITFRGATDAALLSYQDSSGSATVRYLAGTLSTLAGTSWLTAHAVHAVATTLSAAPAGMVNRFASAAPKAVVAHSTAAGRTSNWPTTDVTVDLAGVWGTRVIEVKNVSAYIGATGVTGDPALPLTLDYPAGSTAGDLVVVTAWRFAAGGPVWPSGWTSLGSVSTSNITYNAGWRFVP